MRRPSYLRAALRTARFAVWTMLAGAAGVVTLLAVAWCAAPDLGPLAAPAFPGTARFTDRHGAPLAVLAPAGSRRRDWTPIGELPRTLVRFVVALEDNKFWEHAGVDPAQIWWAFVENLALLEFRYGASTITQQLVKNVWLSTDKSVLRKLQEILLALRLEGRLTKQQILEWYLNLVEMAPGVYGIASGARHYFDKPARALSLSEQAFLAVVITSPRYFDGKRRDAIRKVRALANKFLFFRLITPPGQQLLASASLAFADPLHPRRDERCPALLRLLARWRADFPVTARDRHVRLTLDAERQLAFETALGETSREPAAGEWVAAWRDPADGTLRALVPLPGPVLPPRLAESGAAVLRLRDLDLPRALVLEDREQPFTFTARTLDIYATPREGALYLPINIP